MSDTVLYAEGTKFQKSAHKAFSDITPVGSTAPHSGLYKCVGCGHIVVSTAGNTMPPQNHPQHSTAQGAIRWQLIVAHN